MQSFLIKAQIGKDLQKMMDAIYHQKNLKSIELIYRPLITLTLMILKNFPHSLVN